MHMAQLGTALTIEFNPFAHSPGWSGPVWHPSACAILSLFQHVLTWCLLNKAGHSEHCHQAVNLNMD
jgi:hypothetical protein